MSSSPEHSVFDASTYRPKTTREISTASTSVHLASKTDHAYSPPFDFIVVDHNFTHGGYDSDTDMSTIFSFPVDSAEQDEKLLELLPLPELRKKVFPRLPEVEDQIDIYLTALAERYKISRELVERLRKLEDYEIVILCDDSGSMKTRIDGTTKTRWEVLQQIVRIVFFVGIVFDENGIDMYFLNRLSIENIRNPKVIDTAFSKRPSGYSNLAGALKYLFKSEKAKAGRDKDLLIFVATDAEPTNENDKADLDALEKVMRNDRNPETTHVMFLLCNNKPECVEFLSKWDNEMENVDFTSDYPTERKRVEAKYGKTITFGDYIVKTLLGAIDRDMDKLND